MKLLVSELVFCETYDWNEPDIPKTVYHLPQMYWQHKAAKLCLQHWTIFQAHKRMMNTSHQEQCDWSSRKRDFEMDKPYTTTFYNI